MKHVVKFTDGSIRTIDCNSNHYVKGEFIYFEDYDPAHDIVKQIAFIKKDLVASVMTES